MSDETTPDLTARMDALSPEAIRVAEDVWTEDEPTLAEYELTEAILTAARAAGFGPVRAVEAERDEALALVARVEAYRHRCAMLRTEPTTAGLNVAVRGDRR